MTAEQEHLFELLKIFSSFCEEHNLQYWLIGGTLLGAVRHQGFIPWDDDIDLAMPQKDYLRLLQLKDSLPNGYIVTEESFDEGYPFNFCKVCNTSIPFETSNRNEPKGIYIDIFPLMPSREPGRTAKFIFNAICVIGYVLQVKLGWANYTPYKKIYAWLSFKLLSLCSVAQLRQLRRFLVRTLTTEGTGYCFSPGGGHKGTTEFYPKQWFETKEWLSFEGQEFPCPNGWDAILCQLYGDYMVPPKKEHQKSHHKS